MKTSSRSRANARNRLQMFPKIPKKSSLTTEPRRPKVIIITYAYGDIIITYVNGDTITTNVHGNIITDHYGDIIITYVSYDIIRSTSRGPPRNPRIPRARVPNGPTVQSPLCYK